MKKVLGWVLVFLLVFWIGTNPRPAPDVARRLGDGVAQIFTNIGTFLSDLTRG